MAMQNEKNIDDDLEVRFHIRVSLHSRSVVFKFDPTKDSVLQVQEGDYKKCITTKPIMKYKDSLAKFKLVESGAFYFISGAKESGSSAAPTPSATPSSPNGSSSNIVPPPAEAPKANAARSIIVGVSSMVMTALVAVAMA
ncbi:cupredoxin [Artemisia annua]|uniref:Cupredoxin n=1 Tax=Artemisia annua TaxID=35608 RepID=A0A2U1KLV4_ARTAN|nr:cupredoxin [Artemisia annua]